MFSILNVKFNVELLWLKHPLGVLVGSVVGGFYECGKDCFSFKGDPSYGKLACKQETKPCGHRPS